MTKHQFDKLLMLGSKAVGLKFSWHFSTYHFVISKYDSSSRSFVIKSEETYNNYYLDKYTYKLLTPTLETLKYVK